MHESYYTAIMIAMPQRNGQAHMGFSGVLAASSRGYSHVTYSFNLELDSEDGSLCYTFGSH